MQHSSQTGWWQGSKRLREQQRDNVRAGQEIVSLQTVGISKAYKGRFVVRDVNVEVSQGEVVGLLGPNGAGTVSYTHLRAHETPEHLVCRLLLEKKKKRKALLVH